MRLVGIFISDVVNTTCKTYDNRVLIEYYIYKLKNWIGMTASIKILIDSDISVKRAFLSVIEFRR